tara:strand:+ start:17646 stop:19466 length:1821 start_codon:yes stop_codon:yes gene_type:complete
MATLYPDSNQSTLVLYGDENVNPQIFSRQEYREFTRLLSPVLEQCSIQVGRQLAQMSNTSEAFGYVIARRSVGPILHAAIDRAIRVKRVFERAGRSASVAPVTDYDTVIDRIEEFEGLVSADYQTNSYLIWRFGAALGYREEADGAGEPPSYSTPGISRNFLFEIPLRLKLQRRAYAYLKKAIGPNPDLIPATGFANADPIIEARGLFISLFEKLPGGWLSTQGGRDEALREDLFGSAIDAIPGLRPLLESYGFDGRQSSAILSELRGLLTRFFPQAFLESFQPNHEYAVARLANFRSNCLVSSGDGDSESVFYLAAARHLGKKTIKAQHGGLYGYVQDIAPVTEVEWPSCDIFLSWGWQTLPTGYAGFSQMEVKVLPSPWLSERKNYLAGVAKKGRREFDLLWMPQLMKRYTNAPQGSSSISRDLLPAMSREMVSFVDVAAAKNGISILCKPYNNLTVSIMAKTFAELKAIGKDCLFVSSKFEKGLTPSLLARCRMVVWDQPGTGFLECLSVGMPTVVLWSRIYCEEERWAVEEFLNLEKVGLVHRTPVSLVAEFRKFDSAPMDWISDADRAQAIRQFCDNYALTDSKWYRSWKRFFRSDLCSSD